jgi:hypothetical protein
MSEQAMRAALEVLENLQGGCTDHDDGTVEAITVWCPEVIEQLRAALAQPTEQAEPVALELGDRFMEILRCIHGDMPDNLADSARLAFVHALKESQPTEQAEPVAWMWKWPDGLCEFHCVPSGSETVLDFPLYTAAPAAPAKLAADNFEWSSLYAAVSHMMAKLGADGSISTDAPTVETVMDALHRLDAGQFVPGLTPRASKADEEEIAELKEAYALLFKANAELRASLGRPHVLHECLDNDSQRGGCGRGAAIRALI